MMMVETPIPAAYVAEGGHGRGRQHQEDQGYAGGVDRHDRGTGGPAGARLDPLAGSLCPRACDRRGADDRARFPPVDCVAD